MPIFLQEVDVSEVSIKGLAWRVVGFGGLGRGWGLARMRAIRKRKRRRREENCFGGCILEVGDVERESGEIRESYQRRAHGKWLKAIGTIHGSQKIRAITKVRRPLGTFFMEKIVRSSSILREP